MANQELYQDYFKNWVNVRCNQLQADGALTLPKDSLTPAVESANVVQTNFEHGLITTSALTNAPGQVYTIFFQNNKLNVNDTVLYSIKGYTGTWGANGIPDCTFTTVVDGSCTLRILNRGANALAGEITIEYIVINNS
jgi:hypothetical protein